MVGLAASAAGSSSVTMAPLPYYSAHSFAIYPSNPPYAASDALLSTVAGAGGAQDLPLTVSAGVGAMTAQMGGTSRIAGVSAGQGSMTAAGSQAYAVSSTAAGRAAFTNNYLSSPVRMTALSAGIGGARDQFGTAGKWYLGSPHHITSTSAGRAAFTSNYLGSPVRITMTSAGQAVVTCYLATRIYFASTAAGRATSTMYLASRIYFTGTAAGRATATAYLSSRIYLTSTSAGRAGGTHYVGSRVYATSTSSGQAGGSWYQSGTLHFPNIVMRGVGHMNLGPVLLNGYANGIGHMDDTRLAGTARISCTSNGVGSFRENTVLLVMVSHGSAAGTQMDKPPFAFVSNAGCRAYSHVLYRVGETPTHGGSTYFDDRPMGVFAYLSAPMRFANSDPNFCHIASFSATPTPSTMQGKGSMFFAYEPVSTSNGVSTVAVYQTGRTYLTSTTFTSPSGHQPCTAYMSSRVYVQIAPHGVSTVTFLRFGEFESNGVGGGDITLGAPQRITTTIHGIAGVSMYGAGRVEMALAVHGVGRLTAYQQGKVYFESGLFTSRGVGTFFIDPGLMIAASHGVAQVTIQRPGAVYMTWGRDGYYWVDPDNFPVADPILMPRGSNGIAHCEIEIDTIPIMRQRIDGVGHFQSTISPSTRQFQWQTVAAGAVKRYAADGPYIDGLGRFHYGVEIAQFQPHDFQADGIGHLAASMRMAYALRWQKAGDGSFVQRVGGPSYVGPAGAEGHLIFRPEPTFVSTSRGRGGGSWHMTGYFAMPSPIHGVAHVVMSVAGGTPVVIFYGDMLAQNFSIAVPAYGQIWPRRFRYARGTV